jgi:hypothetical protein
MIFPGNIQKKVFKKRLAIFILTTALFVAGFVINVIDNEPAYNANLNFIPKIQTS